MLAPGGVISCANSDGSNSAAEVGIDYTAIIVSQPFSAHVCVSVCVCYARTGE